MEKFIKVGTITTTHGIKGEVKIAGDNPCFDPSFKDALYIDEKLMIPVHVKSVKEQNGKLIVAFKEYNNINDIEKYICSDMIHLTDEGTELCAKQVAEYITMTAKALGWIVWINGYCHKKRLT